MAHIVQRYAVRFPIFKFYDAEARRARNEILRHFQATNIPHYHIDRPAMRNDRHYLPLIQRYDSFERVQDSLGLKSPAFTPWALNSSTTPLVVPAVDDNAIIAISASSNL